MTNTIKQHGNNDLRFAVSKLDGRLKALMDQVAVCDISVHDATVAVKKATRLIDRSLSEDCKRGNDSD